MDLIDTIIRVDEGTGPYRAGRHFPYKDSMGYLTIGYGRNIQECGITDDEADAMLKFDTVNAWAQCRSQWDWFESLDQIRKAVLVSLVFNMGIMKVCEFKKMLSALSVKKYDTAANELQDSEWFSQVGRRGNRLVGMLRTGILDDYYSDRESNP